MYVTLCTRVGWLGPVAILQALNVKIPKVDASGSLVLVRLLCSNKRVGETREKSGRW